MIIIAFVYVCRKIVSEKNISCKLMMLDKTSIFPTFSMFVISELRKMSVFYCTVMFTKYLRNKLHCVSPKDKTYYRGADKSLAKLVYL